MVCICLNSESSMQRKVQKAKDGQARTTAYRTDMATRRSRSAQHHDEWSEASRFIT